MFVCRLLNCRERIFLLHRMFVELQRGLDRLITFSFCLLARQTPRLQSLRTLCKEKKNLLKNPALSDQTLIISNPIFHHRSGTASVTAQRSPMVNSCPKINVQVRFLAPWPH